MTPDHTPLLTRIADALDRLAPPKPETLSLTSATAYFWDKATETLRSVDPVNRVNLDLLVGIDQQKHTLLENTERFARGLPANNALLWGARGMGKSSLVKAIHGALLAQHTEVLLIEIHREDIHTLPLLMRALKTVQRQIILFCDDLAFDAADSSYKALKAVLEGGLEGRPANILFYATSNRRHLLPRNLMENEQATAVNGRDVVDDTLALSDRFGLWIGFHPCTQDEYFEMIEAYINAYNLPVQWQAVKPDAIEWSVTRGARSGRVAWQFVQDLAGKLGSSLG